MNLKFQGKLNFTTFHKIKSIRWAKILVMVKTKMILIKQVGWYFYSSNKTTAAVMSTHSSKS